MRDALPELKQMGVAALGISPDTPEQQKQFDAKHNFGFPLLCDPDRHIAKAYDVWGQKKIHGKITEGIIRSAFLIDAQGHIEETWYKISPADTVPELLRALRG